MEKTVRALESDGLTAREKASFRISKKGIDTVQAWHAYSMESILRLPFALRVGPIASGNAVVKDGLTWAAIQKQGVRTVVGLEMEAAAISQVAYRLDLPYWIVAKGVMDYADPKKDDRFKTFAARASAEVLVKLLQTLPFKSEEAEQRNSGGSATNVVGNITGTDIHITQVSQSLNGRFLPRPPR